MRASPVQFLRQLKVCGGWARRVQASYVGTGADALRLLHSSKSGPGGFDILLKDHSPPASNAERFLRNLEKGGFGDVPCIGEPLNQILV